VTRVYIALTRAELTELAGRAVLEGGPAFAVTPALRSSYAEAGIDDEEELEYVAMTVAAGVSLTRLDAGDPQDDRRIVVAADTEVRSLRDPDHPAHPARVELVAPVPLASIVSVHVDTDDVRSLVRVAVRALPAAAAGDESAAASVDALEEEELAWYGTQELGDVL